jgi:hypothetical protein
MRFLILINANPHAFEGMTEEQLRAFGRRHLALSDRLADSGELVASEGLANASLAHTVVVRDGQTLTTDGPFAEVKEHLAGFYLIEVESFDRAVEIAAQVPDAELAEVELRPVLDLRALDS